MISRGWQNLIRAAPLPYPPGVANKVHSIHISLRTPRQVARRTPSLTHLHQAPTMEDPYQGTVLVGPRNSQQSFGLRVRVVSWSILSLTARDVSGHADIIAAELPYS